jgi:iron(II)-dependent oxidoreductase
MGSTPAEIEAVGKMGADGAVLTWEHEMPQFRVLMPAFYLGVFAVTNAQFVRFLNETRPPPGQLARWLPNACRVSRPETEADPYRVAPGYDEHPVVQVAWPGAEAYCQWAGLRLPTEIEWEKSARGVDGRLFPWGDEWHGDYLQWRREPSPEDPPTAPVDAFPEGCSPYGLFQMAGNVDEWCADPFRPDANQSHAQGMLRVSANGHVRVVRGGSCTDRLPLEFRCAMRRSDASDRAHQRCIGFRCACGALRWTRIPGHKSPGEQTAPSEPKNLTRPAKIAAA